MSTLVHELLCWTTANRSYQCHWEATAVPSRAPSTAPSSSNRRPAYPRQAHTDTLSNHTHVCLLEPRLFKDIRGILTWSHDSVGNCGMHLPLQSRAEAGAGAHICSCHTNTTCARIALTVSAAEDPLGLTLNFHDLCSGREAGWNTTITLFLLSNHFISSPRFFSHLIPHSNSIPGKERKHILKVTQELIILLEEKVLSMWLPASIGAFQSIEARFSLLKLGIEDIIKVIAVAWWTLDIDSLWMLLFIDKGKCWAKTWLTSLVIQNINVEGIWYNPGCLLSNPTVCWRAVKCFLLIFCSSDTATFK